MVPLVGSSKAAKALKNVVFPQPDGPIKLTKSPLLIVRLTSLSACTGPSFVANVKLRDRASMTGSWLMLIHPLQEYLLAQQVVD